MQANPVIVKELRGRMRGWRSVAILVIYLLILSLVTWLTFLAVGSYSSNNYYGGQSAQIGKTIFGVLVGFQTVMVALLTPAFTAGSITSEREQKTYDLLMTTLLPARSVIFGKLGAALAWVALLILAVAPLQSLAFMFGGVSPEEVILSQVVLLMAAVLFASIGIFWSTVVKSSVASNVLTYGTILFQLLVMPFLYYLFITIFNGGYSSGSTNIQDHAAFWYISGVVLSFHPFLAMSLSEAFFLQGQPLFIYTSTEIWPGHSLFVISPWLIFCIEALLVSALLVVISVRRVKPVRYRHNTLAYAYDRAAPESPVGNLPPDPNVSNVE
jgi:ABC-type transport system involved in multi-copper enzyme maturation permease subunit